MSERCKIPVCLDAVLLLRRHFPRFFAHRIFNLLGILWFFLESGNQTQLLVKPVAWRQPAGSRNRRSAKQEYGEDRIQHEMFNPKKTCCSRITNHDVENVPDELWDSFVARLDYKRTAYPSAEWIRGGIHQQANPQLKSNYMLYQIS